MAGFKLSNVEWETDLRDVEIEGSLNIAVGGGPDEKVNHGMALGDAISVRSNLTQSIEGLSEAPLSLTFDDQGESDEIFLALASGSDDRPHTPDPLIEPPPNPTFVQGVSWGRDVIRALDADDPTMLMSSLQRKGADPNSRVGKDGYGGYRWSAWVHRVSGDTVLHLCLRWGKLKALGGLYPLALDEAAQAPDFEDPENIPLSPMFDLTLRDSRGLTATQLSIQSLGVTLPQLWVNTQSADRARAAVARRARREAFEASKRAGFRELNRAHCRAREEYRLAVRQVGTLLEGDSLLGWRRVLAPPSAAPRVDPEARKEARRNLWEAAGFRPPETPPDRPDGVGKSRGRPGGKEDTFPVDLSEVKHAALRELLERVRDAGRLEVRTMRASHEFRYGGCLGSEGGWDLALCLPACRHLTTLSLPNQRIGETAGAALARGLSKSAPCLTYVDLRSNALMTAGALPFASTLNPHRTLRTLCLDANRISGAQVPTAFTAALEELRLDVEDEASTGSSSEVTHRNTSKIGHADGREVRSRACDLARLSLTCNSLDMKALAALHEEARKWMRTTDDNTADHSNEDTQILVLPRALW